MAAVNPALSLLRHAGDAGVPDMVAERGGGAGIGKSAGAQPPKNLAIQFDFGDDRLTIGATDLEVAILYGDSQVQVERAGETLVSAPRASRLAT